MRYDSDDRDARMAQQSDTTYRREREKLRMLQERHRSLAEEESWTEGLVAKWNSKEKIKTAAGALVLCLNVGVDPPGLVRISPCPTKHCWVDPNTAPMQRALETIGTPTVALTQFLTLYSRQKFANAVRKMAAQSSIQIGA